MSERDVDALSLGAGAQVGDASESHRQVETSRLAAYDNTAFIRWRTATPMYAEFTWQTFDVSMSTAIAIGLIFELDPRSKLRGSRLWTRCDTSDVIRPVFRASTALLSQRHLSTAEPHASERPHIQPAAATDQAPATAARARRHRFLRGRR
jgi:hypothetical protein